MVPINRVSSTTQTISTYENGFEKLVSYGVVWCSLTPEAQHGCGGGR